jgi:hydroxyacylglutathione hydrolase
MKEYSFGPVRFIPGENKGKYPFCHSIYIEGAGILIDPASDRTRLKKLREESDVKAVWLSHWHEDHIMHLDLFDDLPFYISKPDAPMLADIETFLDAYDMQDDKYRQYWRDSVAKDFHFKPRTPAGFLTDGQVLEFEGGSVKIIHTPGHTPGHLAFSFEQQGVLFLGDYDLTKFGPWYGDVESSIADTIASVKRLKNIPAKVWLTGHEKGLFEENPGEIWDQYIDVIHQREASLLELLKTPCTMDDIINAWIVYRKPREPKGFFIIGEKGIMGKHVQTLLKRAAIVKDNGYFVLADN